ncbi:MAG: serine/threonine-protein kinase, partial [Nocardioides sp.]
EESLEQFRAEANVMAQLSGVASIVEIYDADVAGDGRPYLVMEYCPPPSLAGRFRKERISVAETLDTGIQIASAVETAHRAGILHRDIKPHNILTSSRGYPKLTDFGIAGTTSEGDRSYGMSIPWSPPEAMSEAAPPDVRSDVYSLAATLYSLLAGRSPFEVNGGANDNATLMTRIERANLPPLTRVDVTDSLNAVLRAGMSKQLDTRTSSAMALAHDLQAVQSELGLHLTKIDVLDAGASSFVGEAPTSDQHTRVRPVTIIVPEIIAAQGTRFNPSFIQPDLEKTRTKAGKDVDEATAVGAIRIDDDSSGSALGEELLVEDSGGTARYLLVGLAAVALLLGLSVIFWPKSGDKEPDRSAFDTSEVPDALAGYLAAPEDLVADTSKHGKVEFSWRGVNGSDDASFAVAWSRANEPQPVAEVQGTRYVASANSGEIVCAEVAAVSAGSSLSPASEQVCVEVK